MQATALKALAVVLIELVYEGLFGPNATMPDADEAALKRTSDDLATDVKLALQFRIEKKRTALHVMQEVDEQLQAVMRRIDQAAEDVRNSRAVFQ